MTKEKKRVDLLGEKVVEEKVKKKRAKQRGISKSVEQRVRDISKGAIIYVPKDDQIIPTNVPELIYTRQLYDLDIMISAHMKTGLPLLIEGPKGTAKTLAVAKWAEKNKCPMIQTDCSEQSKRYDFIGRFIPVDGEIVFQLGDLPRAIELANEYGKAMIVFEEINALTPNMQKVLNQLFDWRQHVYVPEVGKTFRLKEGCQLAIVATCNPTHYGGTHELNEDMRSRLTIYKVRYPGAKEEENILNILFKNYTDDVEYYLNQFVKLADETRRGNNQDQLSYALSTRDVVHLLQNYLAYKEIFAQKDFCDDPEEDAMTLTKDIFLSKFDYNEQDTLEARWRTIIGSTS